MPIEKIDSNAVAVRARRKGSRIREAGRGGWTMETRRMAAAARYTEEEEEDISSGPQ